jgi:hypothetical protein
MIEVVIRSAVTSLPVVFLLCVTGLALKIGLASVVLFISIKILLDLNLWLAYDFGKDNK